MNTLDDEVVVINQALPRKRHRVLRSCIECHRRKQKCNRLQPCQHCRGRAKPGLCRYENVDDKHAQQSAAVEGPVDSDGARTETSKASHSSSLPETDPLSPQDHTNLVSVLGYSPHSAHNPLGLVKQVGATPESTSRRPPALTSKQRALDHKFRSLVYQLPSKEHSDLLVQQFFRDINWHYDVIDEIAFRQQLEKWRRIPYSAYNNATSVLHADELAFPSLLFQLIAHALIHQSVSDGLCSILDSLKYASDMTFVDLACDFSEAGYSTLETIGKQEVTLVAVQTGILRASLLKNTGKVIEAWHVLGTTIRDAQELGLHAEIASRDSSESIDVQWDEQMRRKIWFVLHNWDIHMAVVLGRPMTTTMAGSSTLLLPDDLAHRESETSPRTRTDQDPPTPSSVIIAGYDIAYRYFPQVRSLEIRGARTEDYNIVRETHAAILENMERAPQWSRHVDTDEQFDSLAGCHWLPAARLAMTSGVYFVLLSLHRPYIFSMPESRTQALTAALKIIIVQRRIFDLSPPQQYISFNMVYPLFDALVISVATIMLFPNENLDLLPGLIQNLRWGVDLLSKIGERSTMARAAYGVVKKLLSRLEQARANAVQHASHATEDMTTCSGTGTTDSGWTNACSDHRSSVCNVDAESSSLSNPQIGFEALNPSDLDFATLLPPQPVHDLFYQDILALDAQQACRGSDFLTENPDFDGNYPDNSFWNFVNNFDPT